MNKVINNLNIFVKITYKYGILKALKLLILNRIKLNDFEVKIRKRTSDLIVFHQVFLLQNYNLKSVINYLFKDKKLIVFDLGANVGFFTIKSLLEFNINKIYCFEPEVGNIQQLENNTKNISKEKLEIVKCAISNEKRFINFKIEAGSEWGGRIDEDSTKGVYKVETVIYNEFLKERNINNVDILKIDIEGAEKYIFNNKDNCKFIENTGIIIIELHESFSPGCSRDFFDAINYWLPKWRLYIRGENIVIVNLEYNFFHSN
jgi:FkbM family methyltransferase